MLGCTLEKRVRLRCDKLLSIAALKSFDWQTKLKYEIHSLSGYLTSFLASNRASTQQFEQVGFLPSSLASSLLSFFVSLFGDNSAIRLIITFLSPSRETLKSSRRSSLVRLNRTFVCLNKGVRKMKRQHITRKRITQTSPVTCWFSKFST